MYILDWDTSRTGQGTPQVFQPQPPCFDLLRVFVWERVNVLILWGSPGEYHPPNFRGFVRHIAGLLFAEQNDLEAECVPTPEPHLRSVLGARQLKALGPTRLLHRQLERSRSYTPSSKN
ncbi:hypothetical protein RSAG8_07590, partial [Rhizoctonia solani AG-8 WAC10335]